VQLTSVDWLIMLLYFFFVLGIGFALERYMKTSKDFFQVGDPTGMPNPGATPIYEDESCCRCPKLTR
jgi:hypothetical protein